jgi:hypothetical protein
MELGGRQEEFTTDHGAATALPWQAGAEDTEKIKSQKIKKKKAQSNQPCKKKIMLIGK